MFKTKKEEEILGPLFQDTLSKAWNEVCSLEIRTGGQSWLSHTEMLHDMGIAGLNPSDSVGSMGCFYRLSWKGRPP